MFSTILIPFLCQSTQLIPKFNHPFSFLRFFPKIICRRSCFLRSLHWEIMQMILSCSHRFNLAKSPPYNHSIPQLFLTSLTRRAVSLSHLIWVLLYTSSTWHIHSHILWHTMILFQDVFADSLLPAILNSTFMILCDSFSLITSALEVKSRLSRCKSSYSINFRVWVHTDLWTFKKSFTKCFCA